MINRSFKPSRLAWQLPLALVIVLAGISLTIPSVRASISAFLGLSVAPSNQMPATPVTLVDTPALPSATAAPTPLPGTATPEPTLDPLSAQAGWPVLSTSVLPEGYALSSTFYDTTNQTVIHTYLVTRPLPGASDPSLTETHTITLLQALHNDFVPMQVAPATSLEDAQVNNAPAAYAMGAWDAEFVPESTDPNGGKMVNTWRNDLAVQNLYWQMGQVYLVLVSDDPQLSRQDLLEMAGGIKGSE